ncbi:hypothetical protein M422DRAFT_36481 [Sphaerobolus stellatus SS14]|uniref:Uncharacterized protein n=1 Tax=Sphaerobolus stellatus (strain SS14) TaxID=990650 RepID=A0A0C9TL93_SPHS4|nr:hypothetical protein M422DRAFT_36481 [Sphaerobolus stellatus SS14]
MPVFHQLISFGAPSILAKLKSNHRKSLPGSFFVTLTPLRTSFELIEPNAPDCIHNLYRFSNSARMERKTVELVINVA